MVVMCGVREVRHFLVICGQILLLSALVRLLYEQYDSIHSVPWARPDGSEDGGFLASGLRRRPGIIAGWSCGDRLGHMGRSLEGRSARCPGEGGSYIIFVQSRRVEQSVL